MYKFSPLLNVENIPWFINTPRKWTDQVHKTDCTCKFDELVTFIEDFDLNDADREKIIYCIDEDVLSHHGYDKLCRIHNECYCTE